VTRSDSQRSIVVQVLEGESSLPAECTAIGRAVIRDLPLGLSQGWPVDVTFEYGANGRLSVQAVVSGTQSWTSLEIERNTGLSNENLSGWRQAVASTAGFGAFGPMLNDPARPQAAAAIRGPDGQSRGTDGQTRGTDGQSVLQPGGNGPTPPPAVASLLSHAASGQWETVVRPDPPVSGGPQPPTIPTSGWPSATAASPVGYQPVSPVGYQPVSPQVSQPQPTLGATGTARWPNAVAREVPRGAQPPPLGFTRVVDDFAEVAIVDEPEKEVAQRGTVPFFRGRFFRGKAIKIAGLVLAAAVGLMLAYLVLRHFLPPTRLH
jgi:hypothetical protein